MSVGEAVPTGNTFDKYGSTNPVVRRLMAGFEGTLDRLFDQAAPESVLDVGCGEGVLTYRWAQRLGDAPILGLDLEDPKLRAEWETRHRDNLRFGTMPPDHLPCGDDEFDLVTAIEVLEHVPDPEQTVAEMARVARRHLLASVPREPLWRGLNLARGSCRSGSRRRACSRSHTWRPPATCSIRTPTAAFPFAGRSCS